MHLDLPFIQATLLLGMFCASVVWWLGRINRGAQAGIPFEPRRPVPWSGLDVALLIFLLLMFEATGMHLAQPWNTGDGTVLSPEAVAASGMARMAWLVVAMLYLVAKCGASRDDLGFDMRRLGQDVRQGLSMFLAAIVPVYGLQWFFTAVLKYESEHPLVTFAQEQPGIGILLLAALVATVAAPLVEEFIFRVVLQGWLEKLDVRRRDLGIVDPATPPSLLPILLVSTLFGLMHLGHGPDPIALIVLSLFLGYAYRQTHRIFTSLTLHFCVNAFAVANLALSLATQP